MKTAIAIAALLACAACHNDKFVISGSSGPDREDGGGGSMSSSTSSAGGVGVSSSSSSSAGSGGSGGQSIDPPECVVPQDCPGVDSECRARTCVDGTCGVTFVPAGQDMAAQVAGDCAVAECDGAGNAASALDALDAQDDLNECTSDECTDSGTVHTQIYGAMGATPCGARCVADDRYAEIAGYAFRVCNNNVLDVASPLGEIVGIDWTDDNGTPTNETDDSRRMCGNISEMAHVGDTHANMVYNYGTCAPGSACSVIHRVMYDRGYAYTGYHGVCE